MGKRPRCKPEELMALLDQQPGTAVVEGPPSLPYGARIRPGAAGGFTIVEQPHTPTGWRRAPGVDLDNLLPATKQMLQNLINEASNRGYDFEITSGYRSPDYQARLRARWDSGDRRGLVARPALQSSHSLGQAVDIRFYGRSAQSNMGIWAQSQGYTWGGTFSSPDPVHFALPKTNRRGEVPPAVI